MSCLRRRLTPAAWICRANDEHVHDSLATPFELVRRPGTAVPEVCLTCGSFDCSTASGRSGRSLGRRPGRQALRADRRSRRARPTGRASRLARERGRTPPAPPSTIPRSAHAVVRLIVELPGELRLGFLAEQFDIRPSVEELGVGIRDEGEGPVRRARSSGRRRRSTGGESPGSGC